MKTRVFFVILVMLLLIAQAVSAEAQRAVYDQAIRQLAAANDREQLTQAYDLLAGLGSYRQSVDIALYAKALIAISDGDFVTSGAILQTQLQNKSLVDELSVNGLADVESLSTYVSARHDEDNGDYDKAYLGYAASRALDSSARMVDMQLEIFPQLYDQANTMMSQSFTQEGRTLLEMLARCSYQPAVDQLKALEPTPVPDPVLEFASEPPSVSVVDREYTFVDLAMEKAIRKKLGKNAGEPIYMSDLAGIESLEREYTKDKGIRSLEDLEYCVNLKVLFVEWNKVEDLSPLMGLTQLWRLWVQHNEISDLSPLSRLTGITDLGICHNRISSLEPLSDMTSMAGLYINSNPKISDLSPLEDMSQMSTFQYGNNNISQKEINAFKNDHPDCRIIRKKR